jgi:hypothetical protein
MKSKEQEKHGSTVRAKTVFFIKKKRSYLKNINYVNMSEVIT